VLAAVVAAAASIAAAVAGSESAAWWGAPAAATVGRLPLPTSLAVAALCLAAVVAFAARTLSATTATVPAVVLRQSLLLGELRAIATLRLMAAVTMTEIDPGGGFAAARARDALRDRPTAWSPRWRPGVPRRGGATSAFAWLGVVRTWRASPWVTLALVPVTVAAVIVTPPQGPFGGASLLPSLALAWAAAQLHPGRVPWPGWQIDERARVIALLWLVGVPAWLVTSLDAIVRVIAEASPAPHSWVLLPLALAAAAVVDLLAARTASPRGPATWLTAAVIVAAPAALAGWFGLEASAAASLCAVVWVLAAWARVATALGPGR
jgi:hypothetical protein